MFLVYFFYYLFSSHGTERNKHTLNSGTAMAAQLDKASILTSAVLFTDSQTYDGDTLALSHS